MLKKVNAPRSILFVVVHRLVKSVERIAAGIGAAALRPELRREVAPAPVAFAERVKVGFRASGLMANNAVDRKEFARWTGERDGFGVLVDDAHMIHSRR